MNTPITYHPITTHLIEVTAPGYHLLPDLATGAFMLPLTPDRTITLSRIHPTKDPFRYRLHLPRTPDDDAIAITAYTGDVLTNPAPTHTPGITYQAAPDDPINDVAAALTAATARATTGVPA